ncbi:MAG: hypothetical protein EXS17_07290 [Phycisphaerales bacterium]|nr:hypothetical protein [Phycisphaerales bacterium]
MTTARVWIVLGAMLLAEPSAAVRAVAYAAFDDPVLPTVHVIPTRVFDVVIDGFKQVSSANVSCGSLPGEITKIVVYPEISPNESFAFDAGDHALTLRMKRNTGKKPVDAGSFSWDGAALTWSWNTFPSKDVGDGVKKLRHFLSSSAFIATLADGRLVVLCPPPSELACAVTMQADGILMGSVDAATIPDTAIVSIERISGGAWVSSSAQPGLAMGTIDGNLFRMTVVAGKCTVQQYSPRLIELRELTKQLQENKKLANSLPERQRKILETEDAATEVKIAALKSQVEADRLPHLKAVLRIRATDAASGRVYAMVTATIGD